MHSRTLLLPLLLSAACSTAPALEPATLVLKGGKIVTVDPAKPEAQAMAVRGDTIAPLGTTTRFRRTSGPTRR